jgi:alkanesulfonate monooxygenase SsuD/methylene tetrahydromethanopterin reductase-like flavin-dependent oxidoreductase (luciferase family)
MQWKGERAQRRCWLTADCRPASCARIVVDIEWFLRSGLAPLVVVTSDNDLRRRCKRALSICCGRAQVRVRGHMQATHPPPVRPPPPPPPPPPPRLIMMAHPGPAGAAWP